MLPCQLRCIPTLCVQVLAGLGMTPIAPAMTPPRPPTYIAIMLDGKLVGHVRSLQAPALVARLRDIKAAKLAEEESLPEGAHTIVLDVSSNNRQPTICLVNCWLWAASYPAMTSGCNCNLHGSHISRQICVRQNDAEMHLAVPKPACWPVKWPPM